MSVIAMDCEMVGSGSRSMLARVSIVDTHGYVVFDEYVKPTAVVTDYRTPVSGIRREHLINAKSFEYVQQKVKMLLKDKIVVGHTMHYDFDALGLAHPEHLKRDLSTVYRRGLNKVSLKNLARTYLWTDIQKGEHCSIEDARTTMKLYLRVAEKWEKFINQNRKVPKK